MDKKYGIYVGMVVQNNDPEKRGRIKVFIPHLSSNIYDGWNKSMDDQSFQTPSDDITDILPRLKKILPWSEAAMPLLSTGTSYIYNPNTNESIPEKNDYESLNYNKTDQWNNSYSEVNYDEKVRGTFSVPDVGSKVLVFFREGNILYPIYFSQIYDKNDWTELYNDNEYPNGTSNNTKGNDIHQQKLIINRRGGLFEIVDSIGYEKVRLQHKNGTYLTFDKNGSNIFTPENYNMLIFKDFYSTIRGNYNQRIYKDFWEQVNQNQKEIVGETLDESQSYSTLESGLSIPTSLLLDSVTNAIDEKFPLLSTISLSSKVGKKEEITNFSWDIVIGSGGINLKTSGKFNLVSPYQTFSSEYLEMVAEKGLKINGKNYTHIVSPKIILDGKTFVNNSLDVKNNTKIGGSLSVAGEFVGQHLTAPVSFQVTESTKIQAGIGKWNITGSTLTSNQGTLTNVRITGGILTIDEPHTHYFANFPLKLLNTNEEVYDYANNITDDIQNPAISITDGKTTSQIKLSNYNGP